MNKDVLEKAWIELGDIKYLNLPNPIEQFSSQRGEAPDIQLLRVLRNPLYFHSTAKFLLDIDLLPLQVVILQELWTRRFPMFCAARGGSKCVDGNTLITTDRGIMTIGDFVGINSLPTNKNYVNNNILGDSGFNDIEYKWKNNFGPTIKIETNCGFQLEGTNNHPIKVIRNDEIQWVELQDIKIGDYIPINRQDTWFDHYNDLPPDVGYLFGCLVGDGGYTVRGAITFTTSEPEHFIPLFKDVTIKLWNKQFNKIKSSKYSYGIYGQYIWDELFQKYGFRSPVCAEKCIPDSVLNSNKKTMASFLSGLFDTDGCVLKEKLGIEFCSKSEKLAKQVQYVLTHFGIISRLKKQLNKRYNRYYYKVVILGENAKIFYEKIGFRLARKQHSLSAILQRNFNTNTDILPHSLVLNRLLALRDKFYKLSSFPGKCYVYERQLISLDRLKKYQVSYYTFDKILDILAIVKNDDNYQFLQQIQSKHYFYDTVKSINASQNYTYDVYIPNSHCFVSNGIFSHNSFLAAVFSVLKCVLYNGAKVVLAGSGFRQSKFIYEYIEQIWKHAPILRSIADQNAGPHPSNDRCSFLFHDSWAVAIPLGEGNKVRGMRAGTIFADEFDAIRPDIYERVIQGFGAVSATPVQNVKLALKRKKLIEAGLWTEESETHFQSRAGNQSIIMGTPGYEFGHFYDYWKQYTAIIESKGDPEKLKEIFKGEVPEHFDWRDYSIIRIPYELYPDGFMDAKIIAKAKITNDIGTFLREFGASFSTDSGGFFKRSLIETCVASDIRPVELPSGPVWFDASTKGLSQLKYVIGVDPASEKDNFTIVVIELHPDHRRLVYCWSTTRKQYLDQQKHLKKKELNFFAYCARKIRNLMKVFPTEKIALDSQGGGYSVLEALHDEDKLEINEQPIWEIIDDTKPKPSDDKFGLHIVYLVQFRDSKWVTEANVGLRKDMEDKVLLFPRYDNISLEIASDEDREAIEAQKFLDSLESNIYEIEELKNELTTIIMTRSPMGTTDRWDTPETKDSNGRKGRLRKDRYSALLMANMIAREMQRADAQIEYENIGGFANQYKKAEGNLYSGPSWYTENVNEDFYTSVRRN